MGHLRKRMETGFEGLAGGIFRHRLLTLVVLVLLLGGVISQVPNITFQTDTESFFHKTDPALIAYNAFREQFGRDEMVVVAIQPPDVFTLPFLEKLRDFQGALEAEVPYLKEITSLINARDTRAEGDTLVVDDLLKELPADAAGLSALRRAVLGSNLYPNLLISEDGRFTTVVMETLAFSPAAAPAGGDLMAGFDDGAPGGGDAGPPPAAAPPLSNAENSEVVDAVRAVMARFAGPDFRLSLAGSPTVTDGLKVIMQSNMRKFVLLSLLAIGLLLFILFRRISGVALPLLVVMLSLLATVGLMAINGVSFKLPMMIIPSFLLAVGVGASVHLMAMFYHALEGGRSKAAAMAFAMGHSGLPILMTSLTTAAGLASFATAALAPVADLGVYASLGVLVSLACTLVLLPVLVAWLPIGGRPLLARPGGVPWADRLLGAMGRFSVRHPGWVLAAFALGLAILGSGLGNIRLSHNPLVWFPPTHEVRISTELIDRELKGSVSVEFVVDTGEENGLYEPDILQRMERLAEFAIAYRNDAGEAFVGKANGLTDVVKEIHQALNEDRPEFYALPDSRQLIAQELLLFENSGSDDLSRLVDGNFTMARLTLKTPWRDAAAYTGFLEDLEAEAQRIFAGVAKVRLTGMLNLFSRTLDALLESLVNSYAIAVAVITVLMILLIGRVGLGLLSMLPNLLPIVMTLGLMGWLGMPLDAFTLLIGSIALGLAVDDTIHFFHNFLRYHGASGSVPEAVNSTLLTSGRAMLFTTLVLVTGFWLYMGSEMTNLFNFGLLTGTALVIALLADLMLAPALMRLVYRRDATP